MSRRNLEHNYQVRMKSDLASFQRSWAKEIKEKGFITKACPEARVYLKALFKSKISAHRSGTYDSKNMQPRLFAGASDSVLNKRAEFLKKHPVEKYHEMNGLPLAPRVEEPKDVDQLNELIPETNPDGSPVAISLDLAISLCAQEAYDYCADLLEPALKKGNPFRGESVLEAEKILEILMIESEIFPEGADISEHAKVALQGVALKRSREICEANLRDVFAVKENNELTVEEQANLEAGDSFLSLINNPAQQRVQDDALARIGLPPATGQVGGATLRDLQKKLVLIGPEDAKLTEFFKSYQLSKAQKDLLIPAIRSQHRLSNDRNAHNKHADGVDESRGEAKGMAGDARRHLIELNNLQIYNERIRALSPGFEKTVAPTVAAMVVAGVVLDRQFAPSTTFRTVSNALKTAIKDNFFSAEREHKAISEISAQLTRRGSISEDEVKDIITGEQKWSDVSIEGRAIIQKAAGAVVQALKPLGDKIENLMRESLKKEDGPAAQAAQSAASRAIRATIARSESLAVTKAPALQAQGIIEAVKYILTTDPQKLATKGSSSLADLIRDEYKKGAFLEEKWTAQVADEFQVACDQAVQHFDIAKPGISIPSQIAMQLRVAQASALGGAVYMSLRFLRPFGVQHDAASLVREGIVKAYLDHGYPIREEIIKNILEENIDYSKGAGAGAKSAVLAHTNAIMQSAQIAFAITAGVKATLDEPLAAKGDLEKALTASDLGLPVGLAKNIAYSIDKHYQGNQPVSDEVVRKAVNTEISRVNHIRLKISALTPQFFGFQAEVDSQLKLAFKKALSEIASKYTGSLDDQVTAQIMAQNMPSKYDPKIIGVLVATLKESLKSDEPPNEIKQAKEEKEFKGVEVFSALLPESMNKISQISQRIYANIPGRIASAGAKSAALAAGASKQSAENAAKAAQSAFAHKDEEIKGQAESAALSAIQQLSYSDGFAAHVAVAAVVGKDKEFSISAIQEACVQSSPRISMAVAAAVASAVAATAVKEQLGPWVDALADRISLSALEQNSVTEDSVKVSIDQVILLDESIAPPSEEARKNIYRSAWRAYAETLGLQAIEDAKKLLPPNVSKPKEQTISAISAAVVVAGISSGMSAKDSAEMAKRIVKYYVEQENVSRVDMAALAAQEPKINLTPIQINKLRLAAQAAAEISEPVDAVSAGTSVAAKVFPAFNHPEQASAMAAVVAKACKGSSAAIGAAAAYAEGITVKAASSPFSLGAAVAVAVSYQVHDLGFNNFEDFDSKEIKENVRDIIAQSEAGIDYAEEAGRSARDAFQNIYSGDISEVLEDRDAGPQDQDEARSKIAKAVTMAAHINISARKLGFSSEEAKELSANYAGVNVTGKVKQLFLITEASFAVSRTSACLDEIERISNVSRHPGIEYFNDKKRSAEENSKGHLRYPDRSLEESDVSSRAKSANQLAKNAFLSNNRNPKPSREEIAAAEVAGMKAEAKVYLEAMKSRKFVSAEEFNKVAEKAKAIAEVAALSVAKLIRDPLVFGSAENRDRFAAPEKVHTSKIEALVKAGRSAFLINKGMLAGKAVADPKGAAIAAIEAIMQEAKLDSSAAIEALQKSIASGVDPAEVGALVAAASPAKPEVSQALAAVAAHFAPLKKVEVRQQPVLKEQEEVKFVRDGKKSDPKPVAGEVQPEQKVDVEAKGIEAAAIRAKAIIQAVGAAAIGEARELPPGAKEQRAAELASEEEYQKKKRDFLNAFAAMRESEGRSPADSVGISSAMKKFGLDITTRLDAKNAGDWVVKISSSDPMEDPKRMEEIEELKPFVERMRACDGFVSAETLRIAIDQFNETNRSWNGKDPIPKEAIKVRPDGSIKVSLEKLSKSQVAQLVDLWTRASEFARDHTQHMSKTKHKLSGNSGPRMPSV